MTQTSIIETEQALGARFGSQNDHQPSRASGIVAWQGLKVDSLQGGVLCLATQVALAVDAAVDQYSVGLLLDSCFIMNLVLTIVLSIRIIPKQLQSRKLSKAT